ncbi:hypothetical protein KBA73_00520 [Patescibacteria group bacterium]|nr:hypothetical protein [Patescibacteria group bacterium]
MFKETMGMPAEGEAPAFDIRNMMNGGPLAGDGGDGKKPPEAGAAAAAAPRPRKEGGDGEGQEGDGEAPAEVDKN